MKIVQSAFVFIHLLVCTQVLCEEFSDCVEDCCDNHRLCSFWTSQGECTKNSEWMLPNCAKSCAVCTPSHTTTKSKRPIFGAKTGCSFKSAVEAVRRLLTSSNVLRRGCARTNAPNQCGRDICYHKHFRTFDGSCNNMEHSLKGAAFTHFVRLLPASYDDGINAVSDSMRRQRPSPRLVSRALLSSRRALASRASSMLMQFGQFLSHDMSKNKLDGRCNCNGGGPECISIALSPIDSRSHKLPCLPLKRAVPVCGTGFGGVSREQMNVNTAFIDASQVYGSDATSQRKIRAGFRSGLVMIPIGGRMFPPMGGKTTFSTGDDRSNLFVGLAALHTVFVRLHNRVDAGLRKMNVGWNGDRSFQETRKIVGAMMQVITYKELLPALLGSLHDTLIPRYARYDPNANPAISNEFAGAAYRLHGLIQEFYELRNRRFDVVGRTRFVESTFQVERIINGGIDSLIRGLVSQPARLPQRITTQVTEFLGGGMLDMASINIQRGRDHGFPTYNHYRKMCKLPPITSFEDWPEVNEVEVRQRVKELYKNPEHIDLYVGGVIEDPVDGSILGPTFACIIADQFIRSRDGDRFYFENPEQFTMAQILALKGVSLSSILCETADDLPFIPRNVFLVGNQSTVPCTSIPRIDLSPWQE